MWYRPLTQLRQLSFRMERANLKPRDLKLMVGELNRVYEALSKKRNLTLPLNRQEFLIA